MAMSSDEIEQQRQLLGSHRQTLGVLLNQQALLGMAHAPPAVVTGITEARRNIWRIKQILRSWGVAEADSPDDSDERPPAHALLSDTPIGAGLDTVEHDDRFSASLRDYLAQLHHQVDRLTQEQFRVIQMLSGVRRVRISGSAGSGKTLVAAEKALRLAHAGLKTLFLCHNPLLAEYVGHLVAGSGVHVVAFGRWVAELAGIAPSYGLARWSNYDEPDPQTLVAAFDALFARGAQYDAVIVDEGQDFRDEWWMLVEGALANVEAGIIYIFHDDLQALLPHRATYLINDPVINLSRNCRNAGRVYELMRFFHPRSPAAEELLKDQGHLLIQPFSPGEEATAIEEVLRQLTQHGFGDDCVLLLGGTYALETTALAGLTVSIPPEQRWQDAVRSIFGHWIYLQDPRGVMFPAADAATLLHDLDQLSASALPTPRDIELVCQLARQFKLDPGVRRKIGEHPHLREGMRWVVSDHQLRLHRPAMSRTLPLCAAETLLHFETAAWAAGLPPPKQVLLRPHYQKSDGASLPMYAVADFKGLEADTVMLVIGGRLSSIEEQIYVGISRARIVLAILVDRSTSQLFPYVSNSLKRIGAEGGDQPKRG